VRLTPRTTSVPPNQMWRSSIASSGVIASCYVIVYSRPALQHPLRLRKNGDRPLTDIRTVELLFLLLLLFIIAFGQLARRIGTPYPIVMIVGGLLLGLIPASPSIRI
jgi:hypothetical protein